uniref:Uncharacterized protein TCIL3000_5_5390 n=1 Tax=Trypanosoma congolense (strain IL3000) TaxID=1068625 RepID=G0UMB0_TRYCI|nr:unnamed protein product [Trypanosoma congolense IL3000]
MKVLFGIRMKAVVLGMVVVSMAMSLGSAAHGSKNGFDVLCEVLRSAERVLNDTGRKDGPLKEALCGRKDRVLTVENGKVTSTGTCKGRVDRGLRCPHRNGAHGCLAESMAWALLCTCTHGDKRRRDHVCVSGSIQNRGVWSGGTAERCLQPDLFQNVWDKIQEQCPYGNGGGDPAQSTLEDAVRSLRGRLRPGNHNFLYLGGHLGWTGYCSGTRSHDVCVAYHSGWHQDQGNVQIPWITKILDALKGFRAISPQEAHPKERGGRSSLLPPQRRRLTSWGADDADETHGGSLITATAHAPSAPGDEALAAANTEVSPRHSLPAFWDAPGRAYVRTFHPSQTPIIIIILIMVVHPLVSLSMGSFFFYPVFLLMLGKMQTGRELWVLLVGW